jgi:hypothetical protein
VKPLQLLEDLESALPGFRAYVLSSENLFDRDTYHGLFGAASHYAQDHPPASWEGIAGVLNRVVGGDDVDNAACTCFLENLAAPGHPLRPLLRGDALTHWIEWGG